MNKQELTKRVAFLEGQNEALTERCVDLKARADAVGTELDEIKEKLTAAEKLAADRHDQIVKARGSLQDPYVFHLGTSALRFGSY